MGTQKSQKGRSSAAPVDREVVRRKGGLSEKRRREWRRGRQQFGGVAQRVDQNLDTASGRAKRAIAPKPKRAG